MIQPLRDVHRRAFLALAAILPAILVAGLMARHRDMPTRSGGSELSNRPVASRLPLHWQKHSIDTYSYVSPGHREVTEVVLTPQQPIDDPDLLLYWSVSSAVTADILQAQSLGPLVPGKHYSLPPGERRGELVLYSLAHGEVVDRARIEALP